MPEPKLLGSEEFRQAALDAKTSDEKPLVEVRLRGSFDTEVKAADDGSRKLSFTISTASVDRMGDTIAVDGWKLASYKKNPGGSLGARCFDAAGGEGEQGICRRRKAEG
jgi:hypothetical protein